MRSEEDLNNTIEKHSDTIRRLCMVYLQNYHDTEDIFQNVFLKYLLCSVRFENEEHKKAWLIRVTINACKDFKKSFFHNKVTSIDELMEEPYEITEENKEILEAVLALPKKYKEVVYLHYYEGYTAPEIGKILNKNTNTIYSLLNRSKQILRKTLGGEFNE